MFFTGNKLHEIFLDFPENMSFFTGQFIQSQFKCCISIVIVKKNVKTPTQHGSPRTNRHT